MANKDFPVFDCDSHVVEPPEIWDAYVPASVRGWVKTQFYFHTDSDVILLNGEAVPCAKEKSSISEVWRPGVDKNLIGLLTPGTPEWKEKLGRVAGSRDPHARLRDMNATGVDQVMVFPTWFVRLALVRDPEAARILSEAYNDWVNDYCGADRKRLFPCAVLPLQSVEYAVAELQRVAKMGFKAAAVRPCFWNERYPTLPEFDPLWRAFEDLGIVLGMHALPSREPLTPKWAERMAHVTQAPAGGLMFSHAPIVYSPGQFASNIVFAMEPSIDSSDILGFMFEAMTWLTTVLVTGWLEKFPGLRVAILEANATWLPLVLSRTKGSLHRLTYLRGPKIRDPYETFYERCFLAFEADEDTVFRLWDLYENVGLFSSDYPHHDAELVWETIELMDRHNVPKEVQVKMLGENARRLYGIEPFLVVTDEIADDQPAAKLPW